MKRRRIIPGVLATLASFAPAADAGAMKPERGYALLGRPVDVRVEGTEPSEFDRGVRVELVRLDSGAVVESGAAPGACFDAAEVFPLLRLNPPATALGVRLAEQREDPGVVLVPMWSAARHENALSHAFRTANRANDRRGMDALLRLNGIALDSLERSVVTVEPNEPVFSGYRLLESKRVVVRTSLGEVVFAPRYDAAPATCAAFIRLVESGFYDGSPIHRVVPKPEGEIAGGLIQAGDPTGSGQGGSGERVPMELSALAHGFGVISLARVPGDPDSASGQFVIALGPDRDGTLREGSTPFGVLTSGAPVLSELSTVAVGHRRAGDPRSSKDRPIASLRIEKAWTEPGPVVSGSDSAQPAAPAPPVER